MPYWYREIVWGRLNRYISTGWIISKPATPSREIVTAPGSLPQAELMLPEFLKGRLLLDEWKILIALHIVRFKAYNRGRMSRLLGKIALAPRGLFFLLLFYIPAAATGGLSGPVLYFPSPIFLLAALWIRRSLRKSLKRREFELDRKVAKQLGTQQVSQTLEKIQNLDQRIPIDRRSSLYSILEPEHQAENWRARQTTPRRRSNTVQISENWSPRTCDYRSCRLRYFLELGTGRGQPLLSRSDHGCLRGHYLLSPCCCLHLRNFYGYYRGPKHRNLDSPTIPLN